MSSGYELLADEIDGRLHAAIAHKGILSDLYVDAKDRAGCWASIYVGRVTKIDKKLDAAIVDLGNGLSGLLPAKHVYLPDMDASSARTGIADMLKPGQTVRVQIKSEAKKASDNENQKMPRLTMKLYVMGQYMLYSPVLHQVTISRRIANKDIITFTAQLKGKGGWIVQACADNATKESIENEAGRHLQKWRELNEKIENGGETPRLIKEGPDALIRALNDYSANTFDHIYIGNKALFDTMTSWCEKHDPGLAASKRLRLFKPERPGQKLFDVHGACDALDTLADRRIHLDTGGSVIIEPASALTLIDVNQGSGPGPGAVNMQAAHEIARQIHLRNLSGAILVDFIGMEQKAERFKLVETMEQLLSDDRAGAQVHGFTRLGIIEITRKRLSATLTEKLAG